MISGKTILLAGVGLLLLSGLGGAERLSSLPGIDRRATGIRHLHLPYTFQPFLTEEAWLKRAGDLRRQIEVSAGLWPPVQKSPLKARIFGKVSKGDYSIEKVFFESYPGFYVTGNLYRPLGKKGPFPGILTPHGHWAYGRLVNQPLASMPGLSINLARQGHVVFAYDMLAYNDSRQVKDHRRPLDPSFSLWGIGWLGIQLWNSIRSVDFLQSLPDVDPDRIGLHRGFGRGDPDLPADRGRRSDQGLGPGQHDLPLHAGRLYLREPGQPPTRHQQHGDRGLDGSPATADGLGLGRLDPGDPPGGISGRAERLSPPGRRPQGADHADHGRAQLQPEEPGGRLCLVRPLAAGGERRQPVQREALSPGESLGVAGLLRSRASPLRGHRGGTASLSEGQPSAADRSAPAPRTPRACPGSGNSCPRL